MEAQLGWSGNFNSSTCIEYLSLFSVVQKYNNRPRNAGVLIKNKWHVFMARGVFYSLYLDLLCKYPTVLLILEAIVIKWEDNKALLLAGYTMCKDVIVRWLSKNISILLSESNNTITWFMYYQSKFKKSNYGNLLFTIKMLVKRERKTILNLNYSNIQTSKVVYIGYSLHYDTQQRPIYRM